MKELAGIIILLILLKSQIISQTEKEIASKITKVTVYSAGAQIQSEAKFELSQGKSVLSFKGLSPYIDEESIRVDGDGKFTIQNVQLYEDYVNTIDRTAEVNALNIKIQEYQDKIEDEETGIKILGEKLDFLRTNKSFIGGEKAIEPETYKSLNNIYGDNIEKYSLEVLRRQRLIKEYKKEVEKLNNQVSSINPRKETPSGMIDITVNSKQAQTVSMKLIYMVSNAKWYPSYDVRFMGNNKPLAITYKANISQNTGIDWKNVEIKLSTAKTNLSAQIPTLNPNYLQFYSQDITGVLQGRAPGLSVSEDSDKVIKIRGISSINTNNDPLYVVNGVPMKSIGYLNPGEIENIEVVKDASSTAIYGSRGANGVIIVTTKKEASKSNLPTTVVAKNETSMEYTIEGEQTINSDNKLNTISFKESEIAATYEYQAIPILSKNVYLVAKISDWSKADLANGETNLYFENSFIGKSQINTQQYKDTLDISFGIDNKLVVEREKVKEFSAKQLIGNNKKETYAWRLSVRNNKSYPIKVKLYDQVPVSNVKEIQVETLDLSGGSLNTETGMVQWALDIKPSESKSVALKYMIKYPKDRLVIEN